MYLYMCMYVTSALLLTLLQQRPAEVHLDTFLPQILGGHGGQSVKNHPLK